MEPLISILLPVYNGARTLSPCLTSVRRQTEADWECVVVDDGSEDDGREIVERFAAADARFRYCRTDHRGLVSALSHGLERCRGRFVARLDADDVMHRERLAAQAAGLRARPDWDGLGCHVRIFPRAALAHGTLAYERWLNGMRTPEDVAREIYIECPVAHPTWLFRREALIGAGYRDCGWPEDYDLLLRMVLAGRRVGVVARRLLLWRNLPQRLSRSSRTYEPRRFIACKAHFLARGFLADTERYVLWGYGGTGRALCRELLAQGRHPSHIVELHPGRLGQRIQGAPVVPAEALARIGRRPIVVSVAGAGPRNRIRRALRRMGFAETTDFVCAA